MAIPFGAIILKTATKPDNTLPFRYVKHIFIEISIFLIHAPPNQFQR